MCKWKYSESNSKKELSGSMIFNTLDRATDFLVKSVNAILYPDTIETVLNSDTCKCNYVDGYLREVTIDLSDGSNWKGRITKVEKEKANGYV